MVIKEDLHRPHFATDKQWKQYLDYLAADVRPKRYDVWENMTDKMEIENVYQPRITFVEWQNLK